MISIVIEVLQHLQLTKRNINFLFLLANVLAPVKVVMTQFSDKISMKFISQLISGISSVLQKLSKYFNRTVISTFLILPAAGVLLAFFL